MAIKDWPGGVISKTPVVPSGGYPSSTASGVWTLDQAAYWTKQQQWPGSIPSDPYFDYVSLLLTGDGTNGAQNNTFLGTKYVAPGGYAGSFDGSGDYLTTPSTSASAFGTGDFCIEAFVYMTAAGTEKTVISNLTNAGAGDTQYYLYFNATQIILSGWYTGLFRQHMRRH